MKKATVSVWEQKKDWSDFKGRMDWVYFFWNWKYCNKIIFKCVNNTVRLIFNEKMVEKCNLWDSWTVHGCTVHSWLVNNCGLNKKKKRRLRNPNAKLIWIQTGWTIAAFKKHGFSFLVVVFVKCSFSFAYSCRLKTRL